MTLGVPVFLQASFPVKGILVEFRPSYFYPISSELREIFGDGGVDYQLTGSFPVYSGENICLKGLSIWTAVDYIRIDGHSTVSNSKTTLQMVPVTLGAKYFFPAFGRVAPIRFYLASGMKYYFLHTHNEFNLVKENVNVNGMGGVIESGFTTTFWNHFSLDVFASYSFRSFGKPSIAKGPQVDLTGLNASGINLGLGIGYVF
jgi:hypothetical protein